MQLAIEIQKGAAVPIYAQLTEQIRLLVHRGVLEPGDAMPTVRMLAVHLGINANTVARVYRDLQREGVLRLERGVGTFVAELSEGQVTPADFRAITKKAEKLVQISRKAGLRVSEVTRLVENLWKEQKDAEG
ncbi:MAG: GntR family transcriptional regulator [Acidobacteriota bacterium]